MKHIITIAASKGGTGKSATALALSHAAVADGRRVLAVDMDPQRTLSFALDADTDRPSVFSVLEGRDPAESIQNTDTGVDLMRGSDEIIDVKTGANSARRLSDAIGKIKRGYDVIVIDTGPMVGELQNLALFAANEVLVTVEPDLYSLYGLEMVNDIVKQIRTIQPLAYAGVVVTLYDARPTANRELRNMIEDYANDNKIPYMGEIRRCVKVRESMAMQQPLFDYAPRCTAAEDYRKLYDKVIGGV